ncbi:PQQ-dependent sugar dehydrogenase [Microbulbifer agarilyticus]
MSLALCSALAVAAPPHDVPVREGINSDAFTITELNADLQLPWGLSFLPDGRMLVAERGGRLVMLDADGGNLREIAGLPEIYVKGQGGLFEVLPAPDFAQTGEVFVSYAHGTDKANGTRISRAILREYRLQDLQPIFTVEPLKNTPVHFGGRMAFLHDGTLLLTTGDGFDMREDAQKLEGLLGKVVRINRDGSVPADNPYASSQGAGAKVWTYGHRNPQGLVYDAASDSVIMHEHGPAGGDEVNILQAGKNYGWPVATYGKDYSGAIISPFTEYEGMEPPLMHWTPSIAPAGLAIYRGELFPQWDGDLLVAALAGRHLRLVEMEGGKPIAQQELIADLEERIRDVRVGPDGAIYLLTDSDEGKLLKLQPRGLP